MKSFAPRPRAAAVSLTAALMLGMLVSCGSPSAPGSGQPHNNATSVTLAIGANTASQGDTVTLGITFSPGDTPGDPVYFEISYDGSLPAIDTLTIPPLATTNDPTPVSLSGYLIIPSGVPDGQFTLTVILPDQGDTSRATLVVKDARAPYYIGDGSVVIPGLTPNAFVVGDFEPATPVINFIAGATDTVLFTAGDNHGVAFIGWAFGPPSSARDSVAVTGTVVQASMPLTVPTSLAGTTPTFSVFVRDSDGNVAADSFGTVTVASYVHHPVRTAAVDTAMTDIAYDAKRKVLYLSERGHSNVLVLSLASMTFQPPIALPAAPAGLDLTPGGDTLVVALANTGDLAFVNLATPATSVVQLASLDSVPGDSTTITSAAQSVRVAADGHVIVGTYRSANGVQSGSVVDLNLATSRDTVVYPGSIVVMTRSVDATRVFLWGAGVILYDGVAHQYTPTAAQLDGPRNGMAMSADRSGALLLDGNALYSGANAERVGYLEDDNVLSTSGYGAAISDSGTTVWLGGPGGRCQANGQAVPCTASQPGFYFRLRVPGTGRDPEERLVELADAPQGVVQLIALRGDSTLIGVGANEIMAFDLTTSTPGPVSSRVASHTLRPRLRTTNVGADSRLDWRVKLRGKTRSLRLTPLGG